MNRSSYSPRVLRSWLFLLGALQIIALLVAFERPAQAYVDPGSGFVFLQIAGSMLRGRSLLPPSSRAANPAIDPQANKGFFVRDCSRPRS